MAQNIQHATKGALAAGPLALSPTAAAAAAAATSAAQAVARQRPRGRRGALTHRASRPLTLRLPRASSSPPGWVVCSTDPDVTLSGASRA